MGQCSRAILDAMPMAAIYTDCSARILDCNQRACEWFGHSRHEMLGRCFSGLLWSAPLATPSLLGNDEVVWLRKGKGGKAFPADVTRHPVADQNQGSLWLLTDGAAQRATRNETSQRLLESRESERLSLARDLHDGAVQDLIAIGFNLAALQPLTGALSSQEEILHRQQGAILGVVRQLRSLVCELRPAGLEAFGLAASLEGLLSRLVREHAGSIPQLKLDLEDLPELSLPASLCLYRGAQEAVNNALRHAGATRITVRLRRMGPIAELTILDDGCGFEVPACLAQLTGAQHYGLAGMAERVQLINGSLSLDSAAGRGTKVRLALKIRLASKGVR